MLTTTEKGEVIIEFLENYEAIISEFPQLKDKLSFDAYLNYAVQEENVDYIHQKLHRIEETLDTLNDSLEAVNRTLGKVNQTLSTAGED